MQPQQSRLRYACTNILLCLVLGAALGGGVGIAQARGWLGSLPWLRLARVVDRHVPGLEVRRAILLRLRPTSANASVADVVANACTYWESKNPERAINFLCAKSDGVTRASAVRALVLKFQQLDPAFAASLAVTLEDLGEADELLCSVMATWTLADAEGALKFYQSRPAETLRAAMFRYPFTGLATLSAERLRSFLLSVPADLRTLLLGNLLEATAADENSVGGLSNALALCDFFKADATVNPTIARLLALRFSTADPQQVEAWIAGQTNALARAALVSGYVQIVGITDRSTALHWVASMGDKSPLKAAAFGQQISAWLAEDRTAATIWLTSDEGLKLCPLDKRAAWFSGWSIPLVEPPNVTSP